ncbi:Arc family DNA-binding protein [Providencia sp. R33]|uniref:Arc family DNA-binding protein n=1 Tax=Providencia sp. R33 TaxID=2828763 RepID=UPI001C5BBE79|nr:Arc family DNA-binding protein [Providencia sp. R33]QXX82964.1 Arc family DNA-binding protein [Providencia sp. R33]
MARDDPKFSFRMPHEVREKLKYRAKSNGRSFNAELLQIVLDALEKPPIFSGYRSDTEKLADHQAEEVKRMVFNTLVKLYENDKK